ncbi:MAG: glycosyltransferase family 4 protein [Gammaproteobacteria bacterium]|nr:glycosyltransferase family 4 protein [Gammaproteobacteria bacterium]
MKILWLSQLVPYPPKGGVLQRAYHLIHELAKYHTVDLIAFNQKDLMSPFFDSQQEALAVSAKELGKYCRNIEFVPIDCDRTRYGKHLLALKSLLTKDPYTINWLKSQAFSEKLKTLLNTNNYDLIHFDTISLIPFMKYIDDTPMVLDHHNIESHMLMRRADNEKNSFMRWYFKQEGRRVEAVEKQICPQFSLNITCSEIDRDRLIELAAGSHVEEVSNGVDIDYFHPDKSSTQQLSLIFAGTLSWYPNIEAVRFIAYEIWPRIKLEIPNMCIDIVGANPPEDIRRLAEKEKGFNVHGFVNDVRPYIDQAAIYICPINDGGGTKLKILDALAMHKAIIAHPIACEGIAVEEGVNVQFATSADEYIAQIKRLMADENERKRLGDNARRLIEDKYAYSIIGKNLSTMYETCVSKPVNASVDV